METSLHTKRDEGSSLSGCYLALLFHVSHTHAQTIPVKHDSIYPRHNLVATIAF